MPSADLTPAVELVWTATPYGIGPSRGRLNRFEQNVLCAVPQHEFAQRPYLIAAFDDGQKMIAGKLADFAGEADIAIGEQNFSLADAARIENDLAGRGIAGVVLVAQAEVEVAERDPTTFPAPADVNDPFLIRQHAAKFRAGFGRARGFKLRNELELRCFDADTFHDRLLLMQLIDGA